MAEKRTFRRMKRYQAREEIKSALVLLTSCQNTKTRLRTVSAIRPDNAFSGFEPTARTRRYRGREK
eukprot:763310-Hanusia_phi.AAC.4